MNELKANEFVERMKARDPHFDKRQEFGSMLFKHIDDITGEELERYNYLKKFLADNPFEFQQTNRRNP